MQTILAFNAEQARKRAATGDDGAGAAAAVPEKEINSADDRAERKRKRKSRWTGGEDDKTFIPGMPTMLPMGLNKEQEEAYLCKLESCLQPGSCCSAAAPPLLSRNAICNSSFLLLLHPKTSYSRGLDRACVANVF